jgi:hypothetical protein
MLIELRTGLYNPANYSSTKRENNNGTILRTNHILKLIIFRTKIFVGRTKITRIQIDHVHADIKARKI